LTQKHQRIDHDVENHPYNQNQNNEDNLNQDRINWNDDINDNINDNQNSIVPWENLDSTNLKIMPKGKKRN